MGKRAWTSHDWFWFYFWMVQIMARIFYQITKRSNANANYFLHSSNIALSNYEVASYRGPHRSSILAAPVQIRWAGTDVQVFAISTIASASRRPKPNLWLKWNPAPFVRQPSSTGLVSLAVLTTMCCTSRQVSLLLKNKTNVSVFPLAYTHKRQRGPVVRAPDL